MKPIVVVPTYNEAGTIEEVVTRAMEAGPQWDILVVDDNSPDGTGAIVERLGREDARIHLLSEQEKGGLGAAYRRGFDWAFARDYDVICQMDGDLSHDPRDLPRLVGALEHADWAIGSRYVGGGGTVGWPLWRRLISKGGNLYVRLMTGLRTRDTTAGFRAYHRHVLVALDPQSSVSDGYSFQIELAIRAQQAGFRHQEIPIIFRERIAGVSKFGFSIFREAIFRVFVWGLWRRARAVRRLASRLRHGTLRHRRAD